MNDRETISVTFERMVDEELTAMAGIMAVLNTSSRLTVHAKYRIAQWLRSRCDDELSFQNSLKGMMEPDPHEGRNEDDARIQER